MSKDETHLSKLASHAGVMLGGGTLDQFGAICFRAGEDGDPEVLLVTTRETCR